MNIQYITSNANNRIKHIKALNKRKTREIEGLYIAEGASVVKDLLDSGAQIKEIYVSKSGMEKYDDILAQFQLPVFAVSDHIINSMTPAKNPQGILAIVKQNAAEFKASMLKDGKLVIALDELSDPGNMGTIIRTADAVAADAIIIGAGCVDVYNEKVVRSSMASLEHIKILIAKDLPQAIGDMKKSGWHAACGHLDGTDFFSRGYFGKMVLVIGNEAHGVSSLVADACDYKWKLPMLGNAESLNAAVAAGIMMYDLAIKKAGS